MTAGGISAPSLFFPYVLISHSLPVIAQMATHIAVMRAGQFVEFGLAKLILERPEGDYTK